MKYDYDCFVIGGGNLVFFENTEEDVIFSPSGACDRLIDVGGCLGQGFDPLTEPVVSIQFIKRDAGLKHFDK